MPVIYVKNADFSGSGLGKYPTNPAYYQDETKAILASNTFEALTTNVNKVIYQEALNNLVKRFKTAGIWTKMDYVFLPMFAQNRNEMAVNLKTAVKDNGLLIANSTMADINFGYRPKSTGTGPTEDKLGVVLPYTYNYTHNDFHLAMYHNKLGTVTNQEIMLRNLSTRPNGGVAYNNSFYTVLTGGTTIASIMGSANDSNRLILSGFDNAFSTAQKKLIGFNTMTKDGVLKSDTYITGNSAAGEKSNSVTVPNTYFDGILADTFLHLLPGDNANKHICNACIISAGKGLTDVQWAAYRAACDALDLELLGTIPTFSFT